MKTSHRFLLTSALSLLAMSTTLADPLTSCDNHSGLIGLAGVWQGVTSLNGQTTTITVEVESVAKSLTSPGGVTVYIVGGQVNSQRLLSSSTCTLSVVGNPVVTGVNFRSASSPFMFLHASYEDITIGHLNMAGTIANVPVSVVLSRQ